MSQKKSKKRKFDDIADDQSTLKNGGQSDGSTKRKKSKHEIVDEEFSTSKSNGNFQNFDSASTKSSADEPKSKSTRFDDSLFRTSFAQFADDSNGTDFMTKARQLAKSADSGVKIVRRVRSISLPWSFIARPYDGIAIILDKMLGKYEHTMQGVPIARGEAEIVEETTICIEDQPQFHFSVKCSFAVFRPIDRMRLPAQVVRVDEGQVVCSIYGVVTANIWRKHLHDTESDIHVNVGDRIVVKVKRIRLFQRSLQVDAKISGR